MMELAVMWIICLGQFAVIAWLGWRQFKPQAVDAWDRAAETLRRLNRTDAENWQIDFDRAAGIEPKPAADAHELVSVEPNTNAYFNGWLVYKCSCGYRDTSSTADMMNYKMTDHRKNMKAVEAAKRVS